MNEEGPGFSAYAMGNDPAGSELLKEFRSRFEAHRPITYRMTYPRQIIPPHGYRNPRDYSALMLAHILVACKPEVRGATHATLTLNAYGLIQHGVPTYFVNRDFARAVAQTRIPDDMFLSDLKWPMENMLFVLPDDFCMEYTKGAACPFLTIGRVKAGKVHPPPELVLENNLRPVENTYDRLIVHFPAFKPKCMPVDYTGTYSLTRKVSDLSNPILEDGDTMDHHRETYPEWIGKKEQEVEINSRMNMFAVKMLLVLGAAPEVVVYGAQARPAKEKHGKVKSALWNPNVIGKDYRIKYEREPNAEPSGVKRVMHWRRGHIRRQRHGHNLEKVREIWIEPILVNKPEEAEH